MRDWWHRWMEAVFPAPLRTMPIFTFMVAYFLLCGSTNNGTLFPLLAKQNNFEWASDSLISFFSIGMFITGFVAGKMFDWRQTMALMVSVIGNALCALGYVLWADPVAWIVLRLLQGSLFGLGWAAFQATVSLQLDKESGGSEKIRNLGMGYVYALGPFSLIFNMIGEKLVRHFSGQVMFVTFFLLSLLAAVATVIGSRYRENRQAAKLENREASKWWKLVVPAAMLPALPLFFTNVPHTSVVSFWMVAGGASGLFIVFSLALPIGRVVQGRLPTKLVVYGGLSLYTVGVIVAALWPSQFVLIGLLLTAGLCAQTRLQNWVVDLISDPSKRGRVMSTSQIFSNLGWLAGSYTGGLGRHFGYQRVWFCLAVFVLIAGVIVAITAAIHRRAHVHPTSS